MCCRQVLEGALLLPDDTEMGQTGITSHNVGVADRLQHILDFIDYIFQRGYGIWVALHPTEQWVTDCMKTSAHLTRLLS